MFRIDTDSVALDQIAALPIEALIHYAEALSMLTLAPEKGVPYNEKKPDGSMRTLVFGGGRGKVTYLILEDQRRVDVLTVLWLG